MMERYAIIVAGGKGTRMGSSTPKQFITIQGRPILMRTLDAFHTYDSTIHLILVLPISQQHFWQELCQEYQFSVPHLIADGGETRFHSVQNGLMLIHDDEALVAVHDGVRPFITSSLIERCYETALQNEAVVPVIPVIESLRKFEGKHAIAVDRNSYRMVQTPQTFCFALLKEAYKQPYQATFTDDASVVEAYGHTIAIVDGCRENIKITTPLDLRIAESLCTKEMGTHS